MTDAWIPGPKKVHKRVTLYIEMMARAIISMLHLMLVRISFRRSPQFVVEVVSGAELDTIVVEGKAILEIIPAAPLELTTDHHVLGRVVQKVHETVLAPTKLGGILQRNVVDLQHRIANTAAPTLTPVAVIERDHTEDRQRVSVDWPECVQGENWCDIDGRIIHIVLNAMPIS